MTDRVPGAPGQYIAVIQAEELAKLQNGENFIITLTRDDQPITPGTPYSKASVLPDELAAVICPGVEDPAPKDALQALADRQIESEEYPGCYYRLVDGEKEWLNPPLVDTVDETNDNGTEYRTTKRYFGKPVYVQAGTLTGIPTTSTALGFKVSKSGHVIDKIVSIAVFAKNNTGSENEYPLPYHTGVSGELRATHAKTGARTFAIYAHGVDLTDYTFTYCVEYTKV